MAGKTVWKTYLARFYGRNGITAAVDHGGCAAGDRRDIANYAAGAMAAGGVPAVIAAGRRGGGTGRGRAPACGDTGAPPVRAAVDHRTGIIGTAGLSGTWVKDHCLHPVRWSDCGSVFRKGQTEASEKPQADAGQKALSDGNIMWDMVKLTKFLKICTIYNAGRGDMRYDRKKQDNFNILCGFRF